MSKSPNVARGSTPDHQPKQEQSRVNMEAFEQILVDHGVTSKIRRTKG